MIATWMLYAMVIGAFVITSAAALDRGARAAGLPLRHVWASALMLAMLLPLILPFLELAPAPNAGDVTVGPITVVEAGPPSPVATLTREAVAGTDRPLLFAWAIISLLLTIKVARAALALRRQRAQWVEREIDGERLFVTPDLGPAVVAIPETRVIVPEWVLSLDPASLATVVRHERQHRVAGDLRLIVASAVAAALVPWNPAVWYLRRRLRLAVEMDCDARVLAEDPRVDRYGSLLLAIAQHPRLAPRLSATLTESTSDLERRIEAMTARPPRRPRLRAALFALLAMVAIMIACKVPTPDAADRGDSATLTARPVDAATGGVEVSAAPHPDNPAPRYPRQLRAARLEGTVTAKFVVDTNGRVDMRSFALVNSTHDAFTAAVREHLGSMRFTPARVGERKVKQLLQMPFEFSLTRNDTRASPPESLAARRQPQVFTEVPVSHTPAEVKREPAVLTEVAVSDSRTQERILPAPIVHATPVYPPALIQANIQGTVIARFTVRADGTVDTASMTTPRSDHPLFTEAVRTALGKMRFEPKRDADGRPIDASLEMPFMFSMTR